MSNATRAAEPWDDHIGPLTHELRQEVSAVLHQMELLRTPALDDVTRRRSLGAIEGNAENLMVFVDDLARLDRLTRGDVVASCRPIDVAELVGAATSDRSRRIDWVPSSNGPAKCWSAFTDPQLIEQVVTGVLARCDRALLAADTAVIAFVAGSTEWYIDVVFTVDPAVLTDPDLFRPVTLDDGLSLYLAHRTAQLAGAELLVQRSGRCDAHLLRLPDARTAATP